MIATSWQTIDLAPIQLVPGGRVSLVANALDRPLRVLLSNISGVTMFFGTATESMTGPGAPGTKVFRLLTGQQVTFVISPKQQLFGVANGAGAQLAYSVSEAMPVG